MDIYFICKNKTSVFHYYLVHQGMPFCTRLPLWPTIRLPWSQCSAHPKHICHISFFLLLEVFFPQNVHPKIVKIVKYSTGMSLVFLWFNFNTMSSYKLIPQSLFEITNLRVISSQGEKFSSYRASKTLSHRQRMSCGCRSRHPSGHDQDTASGAHLELWPALSHFRPAAAVPAEGETARPGRHPLGPGQSPPCTRRGPCTHPSRGCSVPSEDSHEALLLIRGGDTHQVTDPQVQHPQSPSTKLVIFTWKKGSENIKVKNIWWLILTSSLKLLFFFREEYLTWVDTFDTIKEFNLYKQSH